MANGNMTRHFPVRPKAVSKEVESYEAMPPNIKLFPGAANNKIILLPCLPRGRSKTKAAILNFPVRA